MGFLAPWFLGGLVALGVPIFVHLLRRHVAVPRPVIKPLVELTSPPPSDFCSRMTAIIPSTRIR